jgi:hypothetical protein
MQTLDGHFDGKVIVLDEPVSLPLNTRVKILAPDIDETDQDLVGGFTRLSEPTFQNIWDNQLDADYDQL